MGCGEGVVSPVKPTVTLNSSLPAQLTPKRQVMLTIYSVKAHKEQVINGRLDESRTAVRLAVRRLKTDETGSGKREKKKGKKETRLHGSAEKGKRRRKNVRRKEERERRSACTEVLVRGKKKKTEGKGKKVRR